MLPGLVGAGLAAAVYDVLAKPRRVARPIHDAVTTPDTVPAPNAAAAR